MRSKSITQSPVLLDLSQVFEAEPEDAIDVEAEEEAEWRRQRQEAAQARVSLFFFNAIKEGGLIRELSSNTKLTFYPCTVFRHFQQVHSIAAGPLLTAFYTAKREGFRETTSIVYYLYSLAVR